MVEWPKSERDHRGDGPQDVCTRRLHAVTCYRMGHDSVPPRHKEVIDDGEQSWSQEKTKKAKSYEATKHTNHSERERHVYTDADQPGPDQIIHRLTNTPQTIIKVPRAP
jgi:hypothetical protein